MYNAFPEKVSICGINTGQIKIMRKDRSDAKEYLNMRENQSHSYMKLPTLTGTNFEEFDLAFTSEVRI